MPIAFRQGCSDFIPLLLLLPKNIVFQGGKINDFIFFAKIIFVLSEKKYQQKRKLAIHNQAKTRRQGF